jgi:hypothetical protein
MAADGPIKARGVARTRPAQTAALDESQQRAPAAAIRLRMPIPGRTTRRRTPVAIGVRAFGGPDSQDAFSALSEIDEY